MSRKNNLINDTLIELEDYSLKELIGNGGSVFVLWAIEKKTGMEVALKVYRQDLSKEQTNILREINAPRPYSLPRIVKVIDFRFPLTKEARDEFAKKDPAKVKFNTMFRGRRLDVDFSNAIIVTKFMKKGILDAIVHDYLKNDGKVTDKTSPTIRSKKIFGIAATMRQAH